MCTTTEDLEESWQSISGYIGQRRGAMCLVERFATGKSHFERMDGMLYDKLSISVAISRLVDTVNRD